MKGWLAHTDDNTVEVLYGSGYETPKTEARELAKLIRRGLTVRTITSEDARYAWGKTISEAEMRTIAAPPAYDLDQGSAAEIAERLVADMHGVTSA